jgi:hypothetical protein
VAYFKDLVQLEQCDGDMLKPTHRPGEHVLESGIYRCTGCGEEITHNAGISLPPQNHH